MAGGNMMSDNKLAGTAPGSPPVDPLPPAKEQADPKISASNGQQVRPGTDGKPGASTGPSGYHPGKPAWIPVTTPAAGRES